ncbi:MAG: fumarylacetoacetate hydrolase family protein [Nitrospinota bacterium]
MKLATIEIRTPAGPLRRLAAWQNNLLVDLQPAYALYLLETKQANDPYPLAAATVPDDMTAFFRNGRAGTSAVEATLAFLNGREPGLLGPRGERLRHSAQDVRLLPPVPRPSSIRDFLTFEGHLRGTARVLGHTHEIPRLWYEIPAYYRASVDNVIGPDEPVPWPAYTEKLDFELEFGVFIGRKGKDIPREEAAEHIAGYTIFNDWTARDVQGGIMSLRMGPGKAKDFDAGNSMGPFLVTPDEIDADDLAMVARVNGEIWGQGNSGDMHFKFADLIADVSRSETLRPGDFLASGTVPGGCGLELNRWIQPGDVVELEVEGIGILRNPVVRPV